MLDRAALLEDRVPDRVRCSSPSRSSSFSRYGLRDREAARQRLVGVDVGRDRLDAGDGAAADDLDRRGRRDRHLAAEALHHAAVGGVGARPALGGEHHRRLVRPGREMCLKILQVPRSSPSRLRTGCRAPAGRSGSPSRRGRPSARARRYTWRAPSRRARGRYSRCRTLSRKRITSSMNILSPFHSSQVSRFSDDRQQTAVRSLPRWSRAGRQRDLGAQVRGRDLEAELAVMLAASTGSPGR